MISISSHSPQAEQNKGFYGTDILLCIPKQLHIIIVIPAARLGACAASRDKNLFFSLHGCNLFPYSLFAEADIGDRGEKPFEHRSMGALGKRFPV